MSTLNRAVTADDITALHAPNPIVESAERLASAIEVRNEAQAAWVEAKDAFTLAQETQADNLAQSRIRNRPEPTTSLDKLQKALDQAAVERDVTSKVAAELEREHADVIAEHAEEWANALAAEIENEQAMLVEYATKIEAACDRLDAARNARVVASETTPRKLQRLKRARFSGDPRSAAKSIREWATPAPPKARRGPIGRNVVGYGGSVMVLGKGELGREEAR
jgi:hypothetical protein